MPSVSTSDAEFGYVRETVWGTTPSSDLTGLRTVSMGIEQTQDSFTSREISAGAQVRDRIRRSVEAGGSVAFEFSPFAHDDLWESAFRSSFVQTPEHLGNTSVTAAETTGDSFTVVDESSGSGFAGTAYKAGHLIYAENFTNAGNNGLHKVTSGGSVTSVVVTSNLTDEAAPPATARIKVVGFEGGDTDIGTDANGLVSATLDFQTLGLSVGQWLKIGGTATVNKFAAAALNAPVRIGSISQNAIVLDRKPAAWATEAAAAGKTIRIWFGDLMRNGSETHSYTIAEKVTTGVYKSMRGMRLGTINMTVSPEDILSGSMDFIGRTVLVEGAWPGSGTVNAASNYDVLNAIDNVDSVYVSGNESALELANLTMTVNLAPRGQKAIGALGNVGVILGRFDFTGTIEAYMDASEGASLYTDYLTDQPTSYAFRLVDASNHAYMFDIKNAKFGDGGSPNPGEDQDRIIALNWGARVDTTTQKTAQIDRFYYTE